MDIKELIKKLRGLAPRGVDCWRACLNEEVG